MILDDIKKILERRDGDRTLKVLEEHLEAAVVEPQSKKIDFISSDYLGVTLDKTVHASLMQKLQALPPPYIGATGARTTSGNSPEHVKLERRLASFYGVESALLFNSGFDANYGLFSSVPQPKDAILFDELSHASVRDGIKASRANLKLQFKHNDPASLRQLCQGLYSKPGFQKGENNVFVAIETLYSMEGDFAPLQDIVNVMKYCFPKGNAYLLTDEAHSGGVFGDHGRGLIHAAGLTDSCFIQLHTFSKAIGTIGAVILCPTIIRAFLVNFARSFRYSTAQPRLNLAIISTVYDFLESAEHGPKVKQLFDMSNLMQKTLLRKGFTLVGGEQLNCPVICLRFDNPRDLTLWLITKGVLVSSVSAPVVPKGTNRIRICMHAFNTRAEIDTLVGLLEQWRNKHKL